jgi:DNA-directed RNA polymerase specialized sigma24 family protein
MRRSPRPRRTLTPLGAADIDRLVQRYLTGTPINDLANEFGIHRSTVMKHVQRVGLQRRQKLLADRIDEACRLYQQGWSLRRIGTRFDVHANTVRRALANADVQIRDSHGRERS